VIVQVAMVMPDALRLTVPNIEEARLFVTNYFPKGFHVSNLCFKRIIGSK
jgi:hypothetical protein